VPHTGLLAVHLKFPGSRQVSHQVVSRSIDCRVSAAMMSKSLSTCSTVKPPSSAVAAMIKSGIDGRVAMVAGQLDFWQFGP
jgi:hypothetical protein